MEESLVNGQIEEMLQVYMQVCTICLGSEQDKLIIIVIFGYKGIFKINPAKKFYRKAKQCT
jgi:hypothetical protein